MTTGCFGTGEKLDQRCNVRFGLSALRKADAGNHGLLAEIIARAVADSLYRFVVPALAGPSELVPLASLASTR